MQYTLKAAVCAEIVIKKSRFLARVEPVENRAAAQQVVAGLWQQHPEARHVCWALMAGGQSAAVDDGEPSGTAGRPMLEVLRHQHLHNVLATVVRYFGGVKLGAGGLVRAYTDAVAQALLQAEKMPVQATAVLAFSVAYAQEGLMRQLLQQFQARQVQIDHGAAVRVQATVLLQEQAAVMQRINDATQGTAQWHDEEQTTI
ncbi:uncharacterized protein, YigZ family [Lampropedia hyalina DSM 16112]|jgi:uncharacterized YigZ family protein|uniref:Uncharacterized protein, YigZ family n=1 Tax=Lampropedia hyalina DSM 16112 TaxID=1122156 RepID=A0A1M4WMI6_9BURK|nr:YigZ family protein [Lampropedia hyalina]SHE82424.1 uncharacterized protein, YigZ family [Lampropedia hyalina DSM 16112]